MRILVDENIPLMTVQELRRLGHDVLDIRGTAEEGAPDDELWSNAQREHRLLVTTDAGFADLRHEDHHGILIIRLRQPNRQKIHERVMQGLGQFAETEWPGLLVTMRDTVQSIWRPPRDDGTEGVPDA